jgi:hypothetical protein
MRSSMRMSRERLLFCFRVRDECAAQELDDPADEELSLARVEAGDLARGLADVLDVGEQLFVLSPERLRGTHLQPRFRIRMTPVLNKCLAR